jgi:glycosyltransferase involved in cell wall biosynthesis
MKIICHVVEATATGTLSMLRLAANAQAAAGERVSVLYSRRPETPDNLNELFHEDVQLVNIQMLSLKEKLSSLLKIRRFIKANKPDSIVMHSSFGGFLGRIASIGLKGNYFYLPHCISFMRQDISGLKRLIFASLEWVGALKKATYVACSESEAIQIRKYIPFRKCVVVDNAVNTAAWLGGNDWQTRKSIVITVGQIRLQKDPERFAKIAATVLSTRDDVEFVWVGDGEDDYKKLLIKSGVTVAGWKTPVQVKELLGNAKYYLSTALWEGMPVSPIEGMLSGCVAVLSDCAGNVDIVESGSTGFIFSDEAEAAAKIIHLLDHDTEALSIAESGRQHCQQQYSEERYIQDFSRLLGAKS